MSVLWRCGIWTPDPTPRFWSRATVRSRISVLKGCERLSEAGAMSKRSGGGQLFHGHNYSRP